ncbi:hypothetical protein TruAng_012264 [Truncatella angustata]|nr:hypothetical protein TruAng_012264 [Truncatella angustata]
MADREEPQIVVGLSNSIATTAKRVTRTTTATAAAAKPTRRTTAGSTTNVKTTRVHEDDGQVVAGDIPKKVLEMLVLSARQVKELKEMIVHPSEVIDEINEQHATTQQSLTEVKCQMENIVAELKTAREELEEIKAGQALIASTQTSPQASYAAVARTPPTSQPTNVRTLSTANTTPSNFTDALFCTIDTTRVSEDEANVWNAGTTRAAVEKEIRSIEGHKDWRCRAVTMDPKKPQRIKIVCRDESEHELVKRTAEKIVTSGARVLRDELYPIKVDSVNRTAALDENGNIRQGAAEAFGQENETTVAKISWLSKKEVPKAYGSMVVYLTKAADARRLLAEGFFHAGGESGYTRVFERREGPSQCYNCQQVGHKAYQCKNAGKCGRCAKEGHAHKECTETVLRCVPCGGPHESFSRNCPKLYPGRHD